MSKGVKAAIKTDGPEGKVDYKVRRILLDFGKRSQSPESDGVNRNSREINSVYDQIEMLCG